MICEYCNGKGEIINDAMRMTSCPACGGSGVIEQTNEEWFCSLSTEEKAKGFESIIDDCLWCAEDYEERSRHCNTICKFCDREKTMEWLKAVHKE